MKRQFRVKLFAVLILVLSGCGNNGTLVHNDLQISPTTSLSAESIHSKSQIHQPEGNTVINFWPMSAKDIIVQTDAGLWIADTSAGTWERLSVPSGFDVSTVADIATLGQYIWLISGPNQSSKNPWDLPVFYSQDGGKSWSSSSLLPRITTWIGDPIPYVNAHFMSNLVGWVSIRKATSSNFSMGEMFKTTDGGKTWQMSDMPSGEDFTFLDENNGWTVNTPEQKIYNTVDGGLTWSEAKIPVSKPADSRVSYNIPILINGDIFVIANISGANDNYAEIYLSQDSGLTWDKRTTIKIPFETNISASIFTDTRLVVFFGDNTVIESSDKGNSWGEQKTNTPNPDIVQVKYSEQSIWGRVDSQRCIRPKKDCTQKSEIYESTDSGYHWNPIISYITTSEHAK